MTELVVSEPRRASTSWLCRYILGVEATIMCKRSVDEDLRLIGIPTLSSIKLEVDIRRQSTETETSEHITNNPPSSRMLLSGIRGTANPTSMLILRARSHLHHLSRMSGVRMFSTVTGDSGRVYTNGTLIRRHPHNREMDIYKAE